MKLLLRCFRVVPATGFWFAVLMFGASWASGEDREFNGAAVFNNNCARCHNARSIDEFSLGEWAVIMPHMRERAHLTGKETDAVMEFIALVKRKPRVVDAEKKDQPIMSGSALFTKYGCHGCHALNGDGGSVGPSLDGIIVKKGKSFFLKKLKDPQFNNPTSPMPKMPLTDDEMSALLDYLSSI